jgi:WD40 repeat protein
VFPARDSTALRPVAGDAGVIGILHAKTGKLLRKMPIAPGVHAAEFPPDAACLATIGANGDARVWDVSTGKALSALKGHEKDVVYVAITADGQETFTPAEFERKFGWPNDPAKAGR